MNPSDDRFRNAQSSVPTSAGPCFVADDKYARFVDEQSPCEVRAKLPHRGDLSNRVVALRKTLRRVRRPRLRAGSQSPFPHPGLFLLQVHFVVKSLNPDPGRLQVQLLTETRGLAGIPAIFSASLTDGSTKVGLRNRVQGVEAEGLPFLPRPDIRQTVPGSGSEFQ